MSSGSNDVVQMAQMASKAQNAASTISSKIPQGAKDFALQAKEKVLDQDNLRSVSAFFGLGEESKFSVVCAPSKLFPRLKDNVLFFYLNYILLTAIVFVICALASLLNPKTIIVFIGLGIGWFFVIYSTAAGDIDAKCCEISRKHLSILMMIISGIVMFFLLKDIFWVSLGSSGILSLFHALTRDSAKCISEQNATALNPAEQFA